MSEIGRQKKDCWTEMWKWARRCGIMMVAGLISVGAPPPAEASQTRGFFHSGDGHIRLSSQKNGKFFEGRYRNDTGQYDQSAYRAICRVFGAPEESHGRVLSLRMIEFFDFLQDRLSPGAMITITSGYRAPSYNANLRKRGALAAKASLHQYGMAADFYMEGVRSKRIWEYVRSLEFGGTGWYHGKTVHVDVGPARFWDQKTSGVGTGLSDDNKLIGLVTDFDFLTRGDTVTLRFIRMTAFPIQVQPRFELISAGPMAQGKPAMIFRPGLSPGEKGGCPEFNSISEMAAIPWKLPPDLPTGRYTIRARFCGKQWEKMPDTVVTSEFEVR